MTIAPTFYGKMTVKIEPHEILNELLELHAPYKIYDECGHGHIPCDIIGCYSIQEYEGACEHDLARGFLYVEEVGFTCEEGVMYVTCWECCNVDNQEGQSEDCAVYHEHTKDPKDRCATVRIITQERPSTSNPEVELDSMFDN